MRSHQGISGRKRKDFLQKKKETYKEKGGPRKRVEPDGTIVTITRIRCMQYPECKQYVDSYDRTKHRNCDKCRDRINRGLHPTKQTLDGRGY